MFSNRRQLLVRSYRIKKYHSQTADFEIEVNNHFFHFEIELAKDFEVFREDDRNVDTTFLREISRVCENVFQLISGILVCSMGLVHGLRIYRCSIKFAASLKIKLIKYSFEEESMYIHLSLSKGFSISMDILSMTLSGTLLSRLLLRSSAVSRSDCRNSSHQYVLRSSVFSLYSPASLKYCLRILL